MNIPVAASSMAIFFNMGKAAPPDYEEICVRRHRHLAGPDKSGKVYQNAIN